MKTESKDILPRLKVWTTKNDSPFEANKIIASFLERRNTNLGDELRRRSKSNDINNMNDETMKDFFNSCIISAKTHIWSQYCTKGLLVYAFARNLNTLLSWVFAFISLETFVKEIAIQWVYIFLFLISISVWVKFSDNFL